MRQPRSVFRGARFVAFAAASVSAAVCLAEEPLAPAPRPATSLPSLQLSSLDRSIKAQPAYSSAQQYYALVVLGPEAKVRMWVVVDGDTLYVDRNGDADLVDENEKVVPSPSEGDNGGLLSLSRTWDIPDLAISGRYTDLHVQFAPLNRAWRPSAAASNRRRMSAFMNAIRDDTHAQLSHVQLTIDGGRKQQSCSTRFGPTPSAAPVSHMDGPLTLGLVESVMPTELWLEPGEQELKLAFGTPGLGSGSFSFLFYAELPADLRPTIDLSFPVKGGGYLPPRRLEVPGKC